MEKDSGRNAILAGARIKRWNQERNVYICVDMVRVPIPNKTFRRNESNFEGEHAQTTYANGVMYGSFQQDVRLFV